MSATACPCLARVFCVGKASLFVLILCGFAFQLLYRGQQCKCIT